VRLAILLVLVTGVRVAAASCGSPHTALSPPGGHLPPHGTIYLFDTDGEADVHDALAITREGSSDLLHFRATKLATTADYTVHRIELWSASDRDRTLDVRWHGQLLATYTIADDDASDQARVVDVIHEQWSWTCSFADVIRVAVEGNAVAYRIDWDDDRTTVLADSHLLWGGHGPADGAVLEIGHPNCMAWNVDPEQLAGARSFELYALFADGATRRLGASVMHLDDRGARVPVELIRGADVRLPRRFGVAVTTSPHWVFACGGVGGIAGAIVALVAVRRRRRHVPRSIQTRSA
jgi:hypothetical protein